METGYCHNRYPISIYDFDIQSDIPIEMRWTIYILNETIYERITQWTEMKIYIFVHISLWYYIIYRTKYFYKLNERERGRIVGSFPWGPTNGTYAYK